MVVALAGVPLALESAGVPVGPESVGVPVVALAVVPLVPEVGAAAEDVSVVVGVELSVVVPAVVAPAVAVPAGAAVCVFADAVALASVICGSRTFWPPARWKKPSLSS